jgi:hypothetical protein
VESEGFEEAFESLLDLIMERGRKVIKDGGWNGSTSFVLRPHKLGYTKLGVFPSQKVL